MEEEPFVPLSHREDAAKRSDYMEALHEGVPEWLERTLAKWVGAFLDGKGRAQDDVFDQIERALRCVLEGDRPVRRRTSLIEQMATPEFSLNVIDFLLSQIHPVVSNRYNILSLAAAFAEAGSVWAVRIRASETSYQLVRRVPPELQSTAARAMSPDDRAGQLLRDAWGHAFGRHPVPGMAYREAIRSIEALLQPIVSPKDTKATFGKMLGAIRSAPEKYRLRLQPIGDEAGESRFATLLSILWNSEIDRHGSNSDLPLHVTDDEARDAVELAAVVVAWLRTGAFAVR